MAENVFDRVVLHEAFTRLAEKLRRRRVVAQVMVFGGAAMLLAYDSDVTTRDVDSLFAPDGPVLEAAAEVADEMGWPRSWLNNQASVYVSPLAGDDGPVVFDHPNLRVAATPADHLLAMKVMASRAARDRDAIVSLAARLGLARRDEVLGVVAAFFPNEELSSRARMLIEDLFEQ